MRLFCMDLHISVIADFKSANPDIEVVDWCLSGHAWVMNRQQEFPEFINPSTWKLLNQEMIKEFQNRYDDFLSNFDGFIVGFTSSFAMIYEKYNKPIIMLNAVRYDIPFCWTNDFDMLDKWHKCLQRLNKQGLLAIISNNRADQAYTEKGAGITPHYIPSLCLYTNSVYTHENQTFLCASGTIPDHPLITQKKDLPNPHTWSDISNFLGIIHLPYEVSLMSLFEQFTAGCPLFFPSKKFWKENPSIQSVSAYWGERLPSYLSEFSNPEKWIDLGDMYEAFKSPNTYYYDSFEHLFDLIESFQYIDDTEFRKFQIDLVKSQWKHVIASLFSNKFWAQEPRHICYNRLPLLANIIIDTNYEGSGVQAQHNSPTPRALSSGDTIFVKTDLLKWFMENVAITAPITLVTGVSDITPSEDLCQKVLANDLIQKWIGSNIPVSSPKIRKVLIGVGEPERINGNHEQLKMLHESRVPWALKSNSICIPYHTLTHESRTITSTLPPLAFPEYMKEISRRRFVVSMRGNGMDTHRFTEILLMGSVPIVEHSPLDDLYSNFPCIIVKSLENIDTTDFKWDSSKYTHFLDMFWLRDGLKEYLL